MNLIENQISNIFMPQAGSLGKISTRLFNAKAANKYLTFDQCIHQAIGDFNLLLGREKQTLGKLYEILERDWISEGYQTSREEIKFKVRAHCILSNYFYNQLDKGRNNIIVNRILSKKINGRLYTARVDKVCERFDGSIEVIDYKSGFTLSHTDGFQLNLKSILLLGIVYLKLGMYPDYISYYYLIYNKKFTHEVTSNDVLNVYSTIGAVLENNF